MDHLDYYLQVEGTTDRGRKQWSTEKQLEESRLRLEMYRKTWLRTKVRLKGKPKTKGTIETPRSKTRHLLRDASSSYVKRTLDFHHVLIEQMQQSSKQNTIKKSIKEILRGKLMRKYKLLAHAHKQIKVPKKRREDPRKGSISLLLKDKVQSFFERDDNSRTTTGKKQTKTRYKFKKQIRLLSDTIGNLYQKYKAENREKISFITFWRLKPSWIRAPSEKERDTCLCKTCENTISLVECLKRLKAIETTNLESLVNETVCSIDNKECMYGSCTTCTCKDYKIKMNVKDPNKQVTWAQWKTTKVSRDFKSGDKKEINIVGKDDEHGSVGRAVEIFNDLLRTTYRRHLFNLKSQYRHYRELRETLKDTESFIHVDFSENYNAKLPKEIQSMHFGASLPQISLNTGYYTTGQTNKIQSFCLVSDSLRHDPSAVWAYLVPILTDMKEKHTAIEYILFYSDGPTAQYCQKINFYLFSTLIFDLGFLGGSWNFHEAGHGKGIPDGIGGSIKRSADAKVGYGPEIMDAASFVKELNNNMIKVYEIKESEMQSGH